LIDENGETRVQDIMLIVIFVIVGTVLLFVSIVLGKKIREERVSFEKLKS